MDIEKSQDSQGNASSDVDTAEQLSYTNNQSDAILDINEYAAKTSIPLYVIPPSSNCYQSSITKFDHVMSLCAIAARHNISDTLLKDIVGLIQMHLPEQNIGVTDINELKGACGFEKDYLKYHTYCENCKKIFEDHFDECQTPNCDGKKSDNLCKKYFITSNLGMQIKEIIQRKEIWDALCDLIDHHDRSSIADVRSGSGYKELQKEGGFLDSNRNITLSMFIDGVPLFKSSGVSMWPVYFIINEIPPKERFLKKNMLLWGIWQGTGKPKMTMFLTPLVTDLLMLHNDGVNIVKNGTSYLVKAKLIIVTMDLQARAYVTNMTQHNGEFSCLYCTASGKVVKSGAGNCRTFPFKDYDKRTDDMIKEASLTASRTGKRYHGFFGESILSCLPYFSLSKNIVIDYMHGTLLGVTKKFLDMWFDSKYKDTPHYIGDRVKVLDNLMKAICPPYLVHRSPRVLSNTYSHWKASELRNWLLFYSVPLLKGILPEVYLKHYACLVEGTYILLSEGIANQDLNRADLLLKLFVQNMENLYGEETLSLNIHNLTHSVDIVQQWGPLWGYSCFPFESFNGEIKQSVHGTGNVCRQIFWSFQAQKRLAQLSSSMPDCMSKDFIQFLEIRKRQSSRTEAYQCWIIKFSNNTSGFKQDILAKIEKEIGNADFSTASKIVRNGYTMYTKNSKKVKQQNSYTIKLNNRDIYALETEHFIVQNDAERKVFAVGTALVKTGSTLEGTVPHLIQVTRRFVYI
jgi:hypothetical protein